MRKDTEKNKSILFIGGAKSGKSSHALKTGMEFIKKGGHGKGLFVATATAGDEEMQRRISLHRQERGSEWETAEEPVNICRVVQEQNRNFDVILIDCLTLWLSNLMFGDMDIDSELSRLRQTVAESAAPVIMVSNEVGTGIVPADPVSRKFRDMAGRMNQVMAGACTEVYFVVAGLHICMKHG